ncbi:hypothetical protein FB451DRAFT_1459707 [Mycena latifolia]|nr:hypothetical protein FB451DRAFT_1459707 [Mycena latifolia]
MRAVLFIEAGLLPIRFRRAIIVLTHAMYWAQLSGSHFAVAAYSESLRLSASGFSIRELVTAVEASCEAMLQGELDSAARTYLLHNRLETDEKGRLRTVVLHFRHYLRLISIPHRKAFTRFLLSDHNLAVEALRHTDRYRKYHISRAWRFCRFCQMDIEDEAHAALVCTAHPELTPLRAALHYGTWRQHDQPTTFSVL